MTARYAIYFAPRSGEPLQMIGNAWLGRDAENGAIVPQPTIPGFSPAELQVQTVTPRRYGLHATLKPPFRLAPGMQETALRDAVAAFAARHASIKIERVALTEIGKFLALTPAVAATEIQELAAQCVRHFDRFRAPPLTEETAQRLASSLTPRQQVLLAEWGYPYVLDEYRFHITLTERITDDVQRARIGGSLADFVAPVLAQPIKIADLCLFAQTDRISPFQVIDRHPLMA